MEDLSPIQWALLPLQKFATFSGRAPRAEYWWFYLATIIAGIPFRLFDRMAGTNQLITGLFDLALLLPWLSVSVRRLHDTDRSGWWLLGLFGLILGTGALLGGFALVAPRGGDFARGAAGFTTMILAFVILVGTSITLLVFMVLPGTEGSNRYGPDPYGPSDLEEVFA